MDAINLRIRASIGSGEAPAAKKPTQSLKAIVAKVAEYVTPAGAFLPVPPPAKRTETLFSETRLAMMDASKVYVAVDGLVLPMPPPAKRTETYCYTQTIRMV